MDDALLDITTGTLAHYERSAVAFEAGTRSHDVSQNYAALLSSIEGSAPFDLLDLGCGPGRDLVHFAGEGHRVTGLDGCARFCEMARAQSGCAVLHQDFLALDLPPTSYDGIFANASLFHVPSAELPRVLGQLHAALRPRGVLFTSNPRGDDSEGWHAGRYGAFHSLERWRTFLAAAGFDEVGHYYRPDGKPRAEQPWLASTWRQQTR